MTEKAYTLPQWSAAETNRDTKTLDYSQAHKAKPIAKSNTIEKHILRERNTALHVEHIVPKAL